MGEQEVKLREMTQKDGGKKQNKREKKTKKRCCFIASVLHQKAITLKEELLLMVRV
jgi:hypothetical protein